MDDGADMINWLHLCCMRGAFSLCVFVCTLKKKKELILSSSDKDIVKF